MDLDDQLTQEQFHSSQVGCISDDFDVNEFELEEEEEEEEDRIGDVVSSNSDDSDGDQGDRHAMPTPVDAMPISVHGMSLPIPTEVLNAIQYSDTLDVLTQHQITTTLILLVGVVAFLLFQKPNCSYLTFR